MSVSKKFIDNPEECTSEEDKQTFQNLSKVLKKLKTCAKARNEESGVLSSEMSALVERIDKMDKASDPVASAKSIKKKRKDKSF